MLKIISIGVVLCFGFSVLGYSQGRPPARPDSGAPGRPLPSPNEGDAETMEMRPPSSELASEDDASFTISKQVDEVNLILSVTDSKGRFVDNLTADDLNLLDNHKPPIKLNYFQARTNLPYKCYFGDRRQQFGARPAAFRTARSQRVSETHHAQRHG
jgi:hypothetical protein